MKKLEIENRYKIGEKVECVNNHYFPMGTILEITEDRWAPIEKYKAKQVSENGEKYLFVTSNLVKKVQK